MKSVLLSLALLLGATSIGNAGSLLIYEHNGSVMNWFEVGNQITISYATPKPSLAKLGIAPGTIMFSGLYDGPGIYGTAYTFKAGCAPAPYEVISQNTVGDEVITLSGPAPVRAAGGCAVTGYSATSSNSHLKFEYSATHH